MHDLNINELECQVHFQSATGWPKTEEYKSEVTERNPTECEKRGVGIQYLVTQRARGFGNQPHSHSGGPPGSQKPPVSASASPLLLLVLEISAHLVVHRHRRWFHPRWLGSKILITKGAGDVRSIMGKPRMGVSGQGRTKGLEVRKKRQKNRKKKNNT